MLPLWRNTAVAFDQQTRHQHTADDIGKCRCCRCTGDAHAGSPDRNFQSKHIHRPARINQEKVEHHIDGVHQSIDQHRMAHITGGAKHRTKQDDRRPKQHRDIDNQKIGGSIRTDFRRTSQPGGKHKAQRHTDNTDDQTHDNGSQHRLTCCLLCTVAVLSTDGAGNHRQKTDACCKKQSVEQPGDRLRQSDRRRSVGAQPSDHRRVDKLHHRLQCLFQNRRPCQRHDDSNQSFIKF